MTISGSRDSTGVSVTSASDIASIALALRTSGSYGPVPLNSRSWAVGTCVSGSELSANGAVCACSTGYDVRPCIGNSNWGGVNSVSCNAASQTLIVTFQF